MRIGRLEIQWSLRLRWMHKKRRPPVYPGITCDICGERLRGGTKGNHIISKHPEYGLIAQGTAYKRRYKCAFCGVVRSAPGAILEHIKDFHTDKL